MLVIIGLVADEKIRDMAILDYNTGMNRARKEGIKEGIAEGNEQGKREEREKIVKQILLKKFPIETIAEITKLDIEEIEKIRDK